jgi:hypothetical protein
MKNENQTPVQTSPNGAALLILGLLSFGFGPLTAIPGLLFSRKFRPFSGTATIGYFLCWLMLVISVACILLYVFAKGHVA